jgi:hypothetical protein
VKLPAAADLHLRRDCLRINSMLQSGVMPKVNWSRVKTDLKFELGRLLHRKIDACFDLVDSSCAGQLAVVDVDCLVLKEQADICVLHDKHMVHVATFSPQVCSKERIYSNAAETVDVSVELDEEIIGGIKAVGNSDAMQKRRKQCGQPIRHGAAVRPQQSTSHTKPTRRSRGINEAVGCPRGSTISASSSLFPFSASTPVGDLCCLEFLPVCNTPGLDEGNRWCSVRPNKKRARVARFTQGNRLEQRRKFKVPSSLASSMPPSADAKLVAAAKFESGARTLSEWMLCNVLCSLPHGTAATLASNFQLKAASDHRTSKLPLPLPCQSLCRPLPKGAIGIQRTKALHDDNNSALIPGMWTSLLGNEAAVLRFIGKHFNVCLRTTTFRFCWFIGWIPHKRILLENPASRSKGAMLVGHRMHHSAFSKPEIEHLAFSCLNPKCMQDSADSCSHIS